MRIRIVLFASLAVAIGVAVHTVRGESRTLTGEISDSLCGLSHTEMASKQNSKMTKRECVTACVSYATEGSPKLVFVAAGRIYRIANQRFPGLLRRAGDPVAVTADVDGDTLTVTKLESAPASR